MGTTVKRRKAGAKKSSGSSAKKSGRAASSAKKNGGGSAKRSHADLLKLVPQIRDIRKGGGTWKDVRKAVGVGGIVGRALLAEKGYDANGAKLNVETISGSGKSLAKKVAAERKKGTAWYILARATGKSEGDLKALLTEHGFGEVAAGRVYSSGSAGGTKAAKKSAPAKRSGRKAASKRQSTADPSAKG